MRGEGVITGGLQAALFHPILSEVSKKAFGKARRRDAMMSAEVVVGQLGYKSFSFSSLVSKFCGFFLFCVYFFLILALCQNKNTTVTSKG